MRIYSPVPSKRDGWFYDFEKKKKYFLIVF